MKPNMQKKGITGQTPGRHIVGTRKVKKGTNRQKGPAPKASGVLSEVLSQQFSVTEPSAQSKNKLTVEVDPLAKIKLQLFPVDEVTRIGLEKDGHNPFLELTLKASKKISSVIKHIGRKWGGSHIAKGEPVLLPYDTHMRLKKAVISRKWTVKDTIVTAGDVYKALKTPSIYRLSYGWFSDDDPPPAIAPLISEGIKCANATDQDGITSLTMGSKSNELKSSCSITELQPISLFTDISIGGFLSEASLHNDELALNGKNKPIIWDDSLTALSIGGLLSEASLQAKINNNNNKSDPKTNNETLISDSFDAVISSQLKSNTHSILDAEETCHAFAFRKLTKNVPRPNQDFSSNSFRFPHLKEDSKQGEETCNPEPKLELFARPPLFGEDSRSLGLRGLTWNESLGPFDLGNSMPWKVSSGGDI